MHPPFHSLRTDGVLPDFTAGAATRHDRRGIQSVEVGGQILQAAAASGRPMPLKTLAQMAQLPAARAHPYLVSFCKLGLMRQDVVTGYYGLGPLAIEMGLIGIQQVDPLRLAASQLDAWATELGHTVAIAVWGSHGATIVRTAASPAAIHVTMRNGTVVSLWNTASGPLFAAYRPVAEVISFLEEARSGRQGDMAGPRNAKSPEVAVPTWDEFAVTLKDVRGRAMHRSVDAIVQGVSAMAVPVFGSDGAVVLSLTSIGPSGAFDSSWDGNVATTLSGAASNLMAQIGGRRP